MCNKSPAHVILVFLLGLLEFGGFPRAYAFSAEAEVRELRCRAGVNPGEALAQIRAILDSRIKNATQVLKELEVKSTEILEVVEKISDGEGSGPVFKVRTPQGLKALKLSREWNAEDLKHSVVIRQMLGWMGEATPIEGVLPYDEVKTLQRRFSKLGGDMEPLYFGVIQELLDNPVVLALDFDGDLLGDLGFFGDSKKIPHQDWDLSALDAELIRIGSVFSALGIFPTDINLAVIDGRKKGDRSRRLMVFDLDGYYYIDQDGVGFGLDSMPQVGVDPSSEVEYVSNFKVGSGHFTVDLSPFSRALRGLRR